MSLFSLFSWYDHTPLSAAMRKSTWAFAVTEMAHLLALTLLGGVVLVVNLRLLGVVLRTRPAARIARDLLPAFLAGVGVLTVTGILMLGEETMKCYHSAAFRWKMLLLVLALLLSLGVHRRLTVTGGAFASGRIARASAVVSLALWLGVGVAGRAIGYL
jgi:hypothetical protein